MQPRHEPLETVVVDVKIRSGQFCFLCYFSISKPRLRAASLDCVQRLNVIKIVGYSVTINEVLGIIWAFFAIWAFN